MVLDSNDQNLLGFLFQHPESKHSFHLLLRVLACFDDHTFLFSELSWSKLLKGRWARKWFGVENSSLVSGLALMIDSVSIMIVKKVSKESLRDPRMRRSIVLAPLIKSSKKRLNAAV